ncbi:MAG: hypothetical protein AVDCRST_MAG39-2385, partial [uncultured Sphingomonadaceae bacterium]
EIPTRARRGARRRPARRPVRQPGGDRLRLAPAVRPHHLLRRQPVGRGRL